MGPYIELSEYVYGSGSINPQQLALDAHPVQKYRSANSSTRIEPSFLPLHASSYYGPNVGGSVPAIGNPSDKGSEAVVAQSVKNFWECRSAAPKALPGGRKRVVKADR